MPATPPICPSVKVAAPAGAAAAAVELQAQPALASCHAQYLQACVVVSDL